MKTPDTQLVLASNGRAIRSQTLVPPSSERGAAMFIVLMVTTLLSAVGIFAVRSAGLADLGAGYQRQAVQSSYLSEFAARAVAAEMTIAPDAYLAPFIRPLSLAPSCKSTQAQPDAICFTRQDGDIVGSLDPALGINSGDDLMGVLGYGDSKAAFHVEIFEATQAPEREAGESETTSFRQATIMAEARLRPIPPGTSSTICVGAVAGTTVVQAVRGHVRFGPFAGG